MEKFLKEDFFNVINSNNSDEDPFDLVKNKVNFYKEDADYEILQKFFLNRSGKFLIIGAGPSPDYAFFLLKQGWHGVYCEPDPFNCSKLIEYTSLFRNQVTIINTAIMPTVGLTNLYIDIKTGSCTSAVMNWRKLEGNVQERNIVVNTISLQQLFDYIGYDFDYIQTDMEGMDFEVISSFDWSKLPKCDMICTEAGPSVLKQLCTQADFMITDVTPTNGFYKKKQFVLE